MIFELFIVGKVESYFSKDKQLRNASIYSIRRQVDVQMRIVWSSSPLKAISDAKNFLRPPPSNGYIGVFKRLGKTDFVPLICDDLKLAARLDVNFYEPSGSLSVVTDVDSRLKTLFDALTVPDINQLKDFDYGSEFYCLLSDDKLIWEVSVKRTRLLREIEGQQQLTRIRVEAIATADIMANTSLIGLMVH